LNDATNVGNGIAVVFVVVAWMVIDFFLGLGYGIYRDHCQVPAGEFLPCVPDD
jgi:hypothetical protein